MSGMLIIRLIQVGAAICAILYSINLFRNIKKRPFGKLLDAKFFKLGGVFAVTYFFDVLGIGANAPQTASFKLMKLVPDRIIPGTLNTSNLFTNCLETMIFLTVVAIDPLTLGCLVVAFSVGETIGAKYVSKMPEKPIQIVLGCGLLICATIMLLRQIGVWPGGGMEIGLAGWKLPFATCVMLVFGFIGATGIGMYAPMMALVYSLGMSPRAAFPILFSSYVFAMFFAGLRFFKEGACDLKANVANMVFGTIGALTAIYLVKEMPMAVLIWVVVCVLYFSGCFMLISSLRKKKTVEEVEVTEA